MLPRPRGVGAALLLLTACHRASAPLPAAPPDFTGRIVGRSFATTSSAPGGLARLTLQDDRAFIAPLAYIRVDSATRFAHARGGTAIWDLGATHAVDSARVRVWFRGGRPSSITDRELWATAHLVVVDSGPHRVR